MRKTLRYIYLVSIVIFGLTSCKTYQELRVEVARGSKLEIPESINSICFMDRSISKTHSNFKDSVLQVIFDTKVKEKKAAVLDSTTSDTLLFVLSEQLFNAELYDVVVPTNRNLFRSDSTRGLPPVLEPEEVKSICHQYDTDALFVLSYFVPKVQQKKIREYNQYYKSIDVDYMAYFRIYSASNGKPVQQSTNSDSFYYEAEGKSIAEVESKVPTILDATQESGLVCAIDIFQDLIPRWRQENRFFFLVDKEIDQKANDCIENNQWQEFINLYTKDTNKVSNLLRSKLEHNIALGYEMIGELDKAIEWSKKSHQSQIRNNTTAYLEKLTTLKKRFK